MSNLKRFLLLGSLGLTLLVGLLFTSVTTGSHLAFANGCNTTTTGSWGNTCQVDINTFSDTNLVIAIQTVVNHSGNGCNVGPSGIDGIFGSATKTGVECFQSHHPPLQVDGQVGMHTWNALEGLLRCSGNPPRALQCSLPGTGTLFTGADGGAGIWQVFDPHTNSFVTMNTSDSN